MEGRVAMEADKQKEGSYRLTSQMPNSCMESQEPDSTLGYKSKSTSASYRNEMQASFGQIYEGLKALLRTPALMSHRFSLDHKFIRRQCVFLQGSLLIT